MARKALICGVSGQDGSFLAKLLLRKGYDVHGTSRDKELASFGNLRRLNIQNEITLHSLQPTDFRSALAVLDRVRPDEVYNLSGQSSVGLSFEQPLETFDSITAGTINLLECLRYLGGNIRFYNAASSEMFGNIEGSPADEKTAFHPTSPYAVAKAASFWAVSTYRKAYGLHACSGILFNHESPLRPGRFVTRKIVKAAARIKNGSDETLVLGDLSIVRDWGWAPEYVHVMWQMLQRDQATDFVVATGVANSLEVFTAQSFAAFDLDWRDHVRIDKSLFRPSEIMYSVGRPARVEECLGWKAMLNMGDVVRLMAQGENDPDFLLGDVPGFAA